MTHVAARTAGIVAAAACACMAACGGPPPSASTLLTQAKQTIDATQALHFQLSGSNVQGTGPLITGGSGDILRPSEFRGSLDVDYAGLQVSVDAVASGNAFYVRLPTSSTFQRTDPSAYGFGNPGSLMDPGTGLSSLLTQCSSPAVQNDDRYNGEQLHEVACTLPGSRIAALLVDAQPSRPVAATFGISASDSQLRRVVLTGPFFSNTNATFTLILSNYGESVTITPPPT